LPDTRWRDVRDLGQLHREVIAKYMRSRPIDCAHRLSEIVDYWGGNTKLSQPARQRCPDFVGRHVDCAPVMKAIGQLVDHCC
jgi:hypothetical protein